MGSDALAGVAGGETRKYPRMDLYVLRNRLQLGSIRRDDLPHFTHFLTKFLLFPDKSDHFVSITETDDEVSLILDRRSMQQLLDSNSERIRVAPSTWRALQLVVGTAGQTESGIVSSMARPLADHGISIFQLSTYEADNVIVEEHKLYAALSALKHAFADCHVHEDDDDDDDEDDEDNGANNHDQREHDAAQDDSTDDLSSSAQLHAYGNGNGTPSSPRRGRNVPNGGAHSSPASSGSGSLVGEAPIKRKHPFKMTNHRIVLACIDRDNLERCTGVLLRLLFYSKERRFFSVTRNGDSTSFMIDADLYSQFPEDTLNAYRETWNLISIADGPLGFEECGIVADFASALADAQVSIFYLSTYLTDFILVASKDSKVAMAALTEQFR